MDDWDKEIEGNLIENVRLKKIISYAEEDIKKGRIKPHDEVIHNSWFFLKTATCRITFN